MKLIRHTPEMVERYLSLGYWTRDMLIDLWDRCALTNPDKVALVDARTRLTFSQIKRWTDLVALGFCEVGIMREDVLVAQFPNGVESFMACNAAEKVGTPMARCMTTLRHKEMLDVLKAVKAVGVVIQPVHRGFNYYQMIEDIRPELPSLKHVFVLGNDVPPGTISLDELAGKPGENEYPSDFFVRNKVKPGEVSYLGLTSGTTGRPRIVAQPAFGVNHHIELAQRWRLTGDDVFGCLAPFYGGGGIAVRIAPTAGARVAFMEKFDAGQALELIQKERVTIACTVPAQMALMVRHPAINEYDLSSLRMVYFAAASCPPSLMNEVEAKMHCRVIPSYGATEAGALSYASYDDPHHVRAFSSGRAMHGVEIRLVDENGGETPLGEVGEVCTRGATASSGFFGDPEGTRAAWGDDGDGWYHTGDLARLDADGNIYLVGRSKDIIIRGGQNIYPKEIENILIQHPKVLDVSVVGIPDNVMGEKACACIVLRPGQDPLTFEEMVAFLREQRMAAYKLPERVEIVAEFPMSGDGQKVLKRELTQNIAAKLAADSRIA